MAMTDKQVDDLCERLRVAFGVPTQAEVVKIMVDRFLSWKLPESFYPDAGITFNRQNAYEGPHWPIGTNLLTAEQAGEMVRHMLGLSNDQHNRMLNSYAVEHPVDARVMRLRLKNVLTLF